MASIISKLASVFQTPTTALSTSSNISVKVTVELNIERAREKATRFFEKTKTTFSSEHEFKLVFSPVYKKNQKEIKRQNESKQLEALAAAWNPNRKIHIINHDDIPSSSSTAS